MAGDKSKYHAVAIPRLVETRASRSSEAAWQAASSDARYAAIEQVKSELYLIRDYANESLYLIVGSTRALLIGTGSGTPGLAAFVKTLAGNTPIDVAVTSDDPGQIGGLAQFATSAMYLPAGVASPAGAAKVTRVKRGDTMTLGVDRAGRPLVLEVYPLTGHSAAGITLLDVNDRVLFSGDALGAQANDAGLILNDSLDAFSRALEAWRSETNGKYDVVYTAHNYQWLTTLAYVNEIQAAVAKGISEGSAALIDSARMPGRKMIRSDGAADVVASVVVQ